MGSDFNRLCVDSSKAIWIVALVLGSVLIVQYFEFPYGDRVLSLLPLGRTNFNSSDANGGINELQSSLVHHSSPSPEEGSGSIQNLPLGNMIDINHTDENDNIVTTFVSPPASDDHNASLPSVASITDMNAMLLYSRATSFSESPLWSSAADQELLGARFQIEHGAVINNHPNLYAPIYRNLTTFVRSYEIMEQKLKVYIYHDGKGPVFDNPRLRGLYASEGWFMKHLEASSQFVTSNPGEAHLFYLPFSSQLLRDYVYVKDSHSFDDINMFLKNYVETITLKHPFWNRTDGADHFLVACHDWAAYETKRLMANCIRALCNSDIKEGFKFGKDVSLPETKVQSPQNPMRVTGGEPVSKRSILAFFAGKMHGKVRPLLLQHWENKDPDMKIFGLMRKGYVWHMQNSKFCICAKGYEVNSPRVVEAILYGCVPVIISDNFVPPFFDVLNWEAFAVFVFEKDIPNLKNILVSISERRYAVMHRRVEHVRQHFLWHTMPERYYSREDAEDCVKYISGNILDDRPIRVDFDWGFQEGRQWGRGRSGGQVRDEYRTDYDPARGGYGKIVQKELEAQRDLVDYGAGSLGSFPVMPPNYVGGHGGNYGRGGYRHGRDYNRKRQREDDRRGSDFQRRKSDFVYRRNPDNEPRPEKNPRFRESGDSDDEEDDDRKRSS